MTGDYQFTLSRSGDVEEGDFKDKVTDCSISFTTPLFAAIGDIIYEVMCTLVQIYSPLNLYRIPDITKHIDSYVNIATSVEIGSIKFNNAEFGIRINKRDDTVFAVAKSDVGYLSIAMPSEGIEFEWLKSFTYKATIDNFIDCVRLIYNLNTKIWEIRLNGSVAVHGFTHGDAKLYAKGATPEEALQNYLELTDRITSIIKISSRH